MKHEPRPAINMKKSRFNSFGGPVSQVIWSLRVLQDGANSVSQVVESQILHKPAYSVALWRKDSEKGQWPLPDT